MRSVLSLPLAALALPLVDALGRPAGMEDYVVLALAAPVAATIGGLACAATALALIRVRT